MNSQGSPGYIAKLGDFEFELKSSEFQTYTRVTGWRWVSVSVLGKAPRLHFAGKGEDKIKLEGVIRPKPKEGYSQIEMMRQQGDLGKAMAFTYANERFGQYMGRGMFFCFILVQFPPIKFFLGEAVIMGHLLHLPIAQTVDSAVSCPEEKTVTTKFKQQCYC